MVFLCAARIGRSHAARSPDAIRERPNTRLPDYIRATQTVWRLPLSRQRERDSDNEPSGNTKHPFRRVSGIVVEGVERHGCRERRDGPGMALRDVSLERRWRERTRSEAQGRMVGQALLVTFGGAGHPATDKSDPPSRAEPLPQPTRKQSATPNEKRKTELGAQRPRYTFTQTKIAFPET